MHVNDQVQKIFTLWKYKPNGFDVYEEKEGRLRNHDMLTNQGYWHIYFPRQQGGPQHPRPRPEQGRVGGGGAVGAPHRP